MIDTEYQDIREMIEEAEKLLRGEAKVWEEKLDRGGYPREECNWKIDSYRLAAHILQKSLK